MKILIVEDEQLLAEMYRDRFLQEGFEVYLASDSEEGFNLLQKNKPDIILLDILLPKENGVTFLEKLKKDPNFSSIPVVVFCNFDDPETKNKIRKLGVKDYLIKTNFTPQEIVEKVKKVLEK